MSDVFTLTCCTITHTSIRYNIYCWIKRYWNANQKKKNSLIFHLEFISIQTLSEYSEFGWMCLNQNQWQSPPNNSWKWFVKRIQYATRLTYKIHEITQWQNNVEFFISQRKAKNTPWRLNVFGLVWLVFAINASVNMMSVKLTVNFTKCLFNRSRLE